MKKIILYYSEHGCTREYCENLAINIKSGCFSLRDYSIDEVEAYDTIILASYLNVGKIYNIENLKEIMEKYSHKNIVFIVCGVLLKGSSQNISTIKFYNFPEYEIDDINLIYLPGRLDIDKLSIKEKIMLEITKNIVKKENKRNPLEENILNLNNLQEGVDYVDFNYIEEVLDFLKKNKY